METSMELYSNYCISFCYRFRLVTPEIDFVLINQLIKALNLRRWTWNILLLKFFKCVCLEFRSISADTRNLAFPVGASVNPGTLMLVSLAKQLKLKYYWLLHRVWSNSFIFSFCPQSSCCGKKSFQRPLRASFCRKPTKINLKVTDIDLFFIITPSFNTVSNVFFPFYHTFECQKRKLKLNIRNKTFVHVNFSFYYYSFNLKFHTFSSSKIFNNYKKPNMSEKINTVYFFWLSKNHLKY